MWSSVGLVLSFLTTGTFGHICRSSNSVYECRDDFYCCSSTECCQSTGFIPLYVIAFIGGVAVLILFLTITGTIIKSLLSNGEVTPMDDDSLLEADPSFTPDGTPAPKHSEGSPRDDAPPESESVKLNPVPESAPEAEANPAAGLKNKKDTGESTV